MGLLSVFFPSSLSASVLFFGSTSLYGHGAVNLGSFPIFISTNSAYSTASRRKFALRSFDLHRQRPETFRVLSSVDQEKGRGARVRHETAWRR